MIGLSHLLDNVDLSAAHVVLALYGGLITIYVMQKTRYEAEDQRDPKFVRDLRTIALTALSGAMFWSLTYGESRQWEPWVPDLLGMLAIDVLMTIRAFAIWARIKRTGRYYNAPSMDSRRHAGR